MTREAVTICIIQSSSGKFFWELRNPKNVLVTGSLYSQHGDLIGAYETKAKAFADAAEQATYHMEVV